MSLGKVTLNSAAAGPLSSPKIEGRMLFIGAMTTGHDSLIPLAPKSDLDAIFGAGTPLNTAIATARANAGSKFVAWAYGHSNAQSYADVIDAALENLNVELVILCESITTSAELDAIQTKATLYEAQARWMIFLTSVAGIDPATETWGAYQTAHVALTSSVSAPRVLVTPLLYGNELGAFAGRLAKEPVSRSPMRVKSGSVVNPGSKPVDSAGVALPEAVQIALDAANCSVFQTYEGKPGVYCADGNLLESGVVPVVEWRRVLDKAMRLVRLVALEAIADDQVINSPEGNFAFATQLSTPLRQMASDAVREIKPLLEGAVVVTWASVNAVSISITIQPLNAPKEINVGVILNTG